MAFKMNYKKGGFPFKSAFKQVPTFVGTGAIKDLVAPLGEMSSYEKRKLIEKGKKVKKDRQDEEEFKKNLKENPEDYYKLPEAETDNTRTNIRVYE